MRFGIVTALGLMAGMGAAGAQQAKAPVKETPPAETPAQVQNREAQAEIVVSGSACPVGAFRAQRQSPGEMVWTVSREDSKDTLFVRKQGNSGVHFDLKSSLGAVRELHLSVSYVAPGARVMPVGAAEKSDVLEKTFDVSADGEADVDRNLLVGRVFEITSVHLVSATFANGSVWRAPSENVCSVAPSGFLLVGGK